ncbi:unnamed protein product, partial [Lepidochelys olivacea]
VAIEVGYCHIDGAYFYENEEEVGRAIREKIADGMVKSEEMFYTGKLWSTFNAPEMIPSALEKSLKSLQFDYIDLCIIHTPLSLKVECHPYLNQRKLLEFCKSKNIVLMAYSALGLHRDERWVESSPILLEDPVLNALAKKYNRSPALVALHYLINILDITEIRGRMKRNQLSGAQKCKLAEKKKQKTGEIFQNLPKLTFFKANPSEATSSLSSTDVVPKPVGVSETDPSSIGETNTIPEHVYVSETVTDHPTPGGKTDIVLEGVDVSETEPAHAVKNRKKDPGMWVDFSTDDVAYWIDRGPNDCQHHTGPFEKSRWTFTNGKQTRYCPQKIFFGMKANEWLLSAMDACKDTGLVRSIGVQHQTAGNDPEKKTGLKYKPVLNQVEIDQSTPVLLEDPVLGAIAKKYKLSPALVALCYQLQCGIVVLYKSFTRKHTEENFQ